MCLGAGAKARNKAKLNAYKRADQERVSDAMGKISTTKAKNVSYCLLYTSPSPRDATLSRMPSSA